MDWLNLTQRLSYRVIFNLSEFETKHLLGGWLCLVYTSVVYFNKRMLNELLNFTFHYLFQMCSTYSMAYYVGEWTEGWMCMLVWISLYCIDSSSSYTFWKENMRCLSKSCFPLMLSLYYCLTCDSTLEFSFE